MTIWALDARGALTDSEIEEFLSNQTGITVTVDKDWFTDANGVPMATDFQFIFNTGVYDLPRPGWDND